MSQVVTSPYVAVTYLLIPDFIRKLKLMKNIINLVILSLFAMASCTKQGIDSGNSNFAVVNAAAVPAATANSFSTEFTGATGVEWFRNSSRSFTVQFNHSSNRHSAGYDDNGHRSSHSIICLDGPVPQTVLDAFRQNFPSDIVYEWKLRNDGTWRAHIMRGAVKYEATFSTAGALLKFEKSS